MSKGQINNPVVIAKAVKKLRENKKAVGKGEKIEIVGLSEGEKLDFQALRDILGVTNPILLKAFVAFCKDNREFKRFVVDKEYLNENPGFYII